MADSGVIDRENFRSKKVPLWSGMNLSPMLVSAGLCIKKECDIGFKRVDLKPWNK